MFYSEYHDDLEFVHLGTQLSWKHNIGLIEKIKDRSVRKWYMKICIEEGWSKSVLIYQIDTNLYRRKRAIKQVDYMLKHINKQIEEFQFGLFKK